MKKKAIRKKKGTHRKKYVPERLAVRDWQAVEVTKAEPPGLGSSAAGQSGDIEALSAVATGDSESVLELVEEGQDLEAEKVRGIENAPDPDQAEVTTHNPRRQGS
jgi:hypothetical protein